jgi:hypothetical protein
VPVLFFFPESVFEGSMPSLVFVLLITMALYAWVLSPLIEVGTSLFRGLWMAWLPLALLIWLLAGRRS